MITIKNTGVLVLVIFSIGCSPAPKPRFFGMSMGEVYQSPVVTNCEANMAFELTQHDKYYTCQISPLKPNALFDSYKANLSLNTKTLFRITASTKKLSGCDNKDAIKGLLKSKYGADSFTDTGNMWMARDGVKVHLSCVKEYISPDDMTPEQYESIHQYVELAEAKCIIKGAINVERCIDDELNIDRGLAAFFGGAWPTIDDYINLSYFDENTERGVANPEFESLKRSYLSQHKDATGL